MVGSFLLYHTFHFVVFYFYMCLVTLRLYIYSLAYKWEFKSYLRNNSTWLTRYTEVLFHYLSLSTPIDRTNTINQFICIEIGVVVGLNSFDKPFKTRLKVKRASEFNVFDKLV